jgi:dTDP-4-dehydrorhamnose reductase
MECSVVRVGDGYRDSLQRAGHDRGAGDVAGIVSLAVKAVRFPLLWERTAPESIDRADWSWADERLDVLRARGVRPIVGLVHHGSGPRHTSLLDPNFATDLATFARAVAKRYPWVRDFTPVNEPLTTARFSALYGHWYPHARSPEAFFRALIHECRAVASAMEAIREVIPSARLIQTEDYARISSTPRLAYQAAFENERRWLSLDLLCGRVDREHVLYRHLHEHGVTPDDLAPFTRRPCVPDVLGLNYYVTSERWLDDRLERYPACVIGGNGRDTYADVEAVRGSTNPIGGHAGALAAAWERYRQPLALSEVHLGCTREEQLRWWDEAWRAAVEARQRGVDVRAVTAWALFGSHDWDSLMVEDRGHYEPGAFDTRSLPPRPTAVAGAVTSCAHTGSFEHPVLDMPGWWRRAERLTYGEAPPSSFPVPLRTPRPILIAGGSGTLARAFERACIARGLAYVRTGREELDIADAGSVARALDVYRPWAVVNAAGYVRVDDAEGDRARCWRENVIGPKLLAAACAARRSRLATFSSDLVFDGQRGAPYVERNTPAPLSVYGESKAESERAVLEAHPDALVARTSAFFGPCDEANFVRRAVRAFRSRRRFAAARDLIVSPTYIPDLVNALLDLLIDGEKGLWHLANEGAVTWAELARLAATAHGVRCETLLAFDAADMHYRARRPRYSALGSERGAILRPLDEALAEFALSA